MSGGLDFSDLTDDQIVELASALAHEALSRNPALAAAFEKALVSEKERAEAAVRGSAAAKAQALQQIEARAREVEAAQQREILRQKNRNAMAHFLRAAAAITDRPVAGLTLVYKANEYGRGPCVQLNVGATGDSHDWHLVSYSGRTQALKTSPGLRTKTGELLAWARETAAGAQALGLIGIVVQGVEL
jgi:hypothetical protein